MHIVVASDHAGFALKQVVTGHLRDRGHEVEDIGTYSAEPVDYPWYCADAARAVVQGRAEIGVVMGGSGQGEAIAANKVIGARAALCHDETTARLARQHNDANLLSLGARILGTDLTLAIVDAFLAGSFEGGRHVGRLAEVAAIEQEEARRAVGQSEASEATDLDEGRTAQGRTRPPRRPTWTRTDRGIGPDGTPRTVG